MILLKLVSFCFPWAIRRVILNRFFGYKIHKQAYIGLAWIFPKELNMASGAKIDHLTVAVHLTCIEMEANTMIGRSNWITGFSTNTNSLHFKHQYDRQARLMMKENSAITKNHHIDCTNLISVGRFATIAGYNSQLLTHSINLIDNRQDSAPIYIGDYTFVGTNVVILGGASLPNYSVLAGKSFLNKILIKEWTVYGGIPAKALREVPKNAKYFSRKEGFVY